MHETVGPSSERADYCHRGRSLVFEHDACVALEHRRWRNQRARRTCSGWRGAASAIRFARKLASLIAETHEAHEILPPYRLMRALAPEEFREYRT